MIQIDLNASTLFIPKSEDFIDLCELKKLQKLESITVDEDNNNYCSKNNLLLSKDSKHLLFVPSSLRVINIPDSVESFDETVFDNIREDIENFTYPFSIFKDKEHPLSNSGLLKLCPFIKPNHLSIEYKKKSINTLTKKIIDGKLPAITKKPWENYIYEHRRRFYNNYHTDAKQLVVSLCKIKKLKLDDIKEALYVFEENNNTELSNILLQYQNENFTKEEISSSKTNNIYLDRRNSIAQLRKDWDFGIKDDNSIILTSFKGQAEEITVPTFIGKQSITGLLYYTFSPNRPNIYPEDKLRRNRIKIINIKNELITQIPCYLCEACENLHTVKLTEGVTLIEQGAFRSCINLKNINFPNSLKKIGEMAFAGCQKIEKVELPSFLTTLKEAAFSMCLNLESINFPDSLEEIGVLCFAGCKKLNHVILPKKLEEVPSCMFSNCFSLTSIEIGDNTKRIGSSAFSFCKKLSNIILPSSITEIEHSAFDHCESLKSIKIPENITELYHSTFAFCINLHSITLPANLLHIGEVEYYGRNEVGCFESCITLSKIKLPKNLESLDARTFRNCINLQEIVIPDNVTEIGDMCFQGCSNLTKVVLPKNLTKIGSKVFASCTNLKELYIPDSLKYLSQDAFLDSGIKVLSFPRKEIGSDEYNNYDIDYLNGINIIVRSEV